MSKKITCTRRIQFCSGHRVFGHENKCANVHGHNYVALFKAEAETGLDSIGRVIDFSVLKERIGGWIDACWDHGFLVCKDDKDVRSALRKVPGTKVFSMLDNPTAENMAEYLLQQVCPEVLRDTSVRVVSVTIWETENCFATASLQEEP